jgi:putative transposase
MGSVGDCFDNVMCDSSCRYKLLNRGSFETQVEACVALFDFIEGWYNHSRHPTLDDLRLIKNERSQIKTLSAARWLATQAGAPRHNAQVLIVLDALLKN